MVVSKQTFLTLAALLAENIRKLSLKFLKIAVISILVLVVSSCLKEKFSPEKLKDEWNPLLAAPIINSTLGVHHIFENSDAENVVVVDPKTGVLTLVYKGELVSFDPSDILVIPDQSVKHVMSLSPPEIDELKQLGTLIKRVKVSQDFVIGHDVQLDSIVIKTGEINFNSRNNLPCKGNLKVIMPWLVKNKKPYEFDFPFTGSGAVFNKDHDLSGYSVVLSKGPGDFNRFEMEFILTLTYNNEQIRDDQESHFSFSTKNWNFKGVFGYFGKPKVALDKDSVHLNIFNNATEGYFALTNPRIKLQIDNSFGFPIQININQLTSMNFFSGAQTHLMLHNFQNPFDILAPNFYEIGRSKRSELLINNTNSNVDSLLTPTPQVFIYGIEANGNVNYPPSPINRNFMTDESRFVVSTDLELPLEGFAYGFSLIDTLDFSFNEPRPEAIDSVLFRISIENSFPLDVKMQLTFLDENKQVIDSLLPASMNYIIKSGIVNSEGRVTASAKNVMDIRYDERRVQSLNKSKYIIVKGTANTFEASGSNSNNQVVKIFEDYKITVKAGVKVSSRPGKL